MHDPVPWIGLRVQTSHAVVDDEFPLVMEVDERLSHLARRPRVADELKLPSSQAVDAVTGWSLAAWCDLVVSPVVPGGNPDRQSRLRETSPPVARARTWHMPRAPMTGEI